MQRIVATIGVFDGVHRGHASLLNAVLETAAALGAIPAVIGFDPHPVEVLAPGMPPRRLTPRGAQVRHFAEFGFERAWFIPFSPEWAARSPLAFADELRARFELAHLWVGHDFRFGRDRAGGFDLLSEQGKQWGFTVEQHGALREGHRVVSSTWVREALGDGDLETVTLLLGRRFSTEGRVVTGRGQGGKLLVPTANVRFVAGQCLPRRGVYTCWAEIEGHCLPAVANVGHRPTLTAETWDTVEVHVIDQQVELLGASLAVHWGLRLRDETKFDRLEDLRTAVFADIDRARQWHRINTGVRPSGAAQS